MDSQYGIAHSPIGPSPSQSPLAFQPFGSAPSGPPSAYSSALARSASASGSRNMSKLGRSTSGNTFSASRSDTSAAAAAAMTADHHDAIQGAVQPGSSPGASNSAGLPLLSEEGSSVRSAASTASLTDIAQYEAQVPDQPSEASLGTASAAHGSTPTFINHQITTPEQTPSSDATKSGMPQTGPDQQAAATDESAHQAGTQAAYESQAAAPDKAQLQQFKDAVLRGEDQAMQESLAAANAAGGEQVRDALPSSSSGLQGTTATPEASPVLQHAPLHQDTEAVSTSSAAGCDDGSERASSGASAGAASGHIQLPAEGGTASAQQADSGGDRLAESGRASSSGQIADRYRWGVAIIPLEACASYLLLMMLHPSLTHPVFQSCID